MAGRLIIDDDNHPVPGGVTVLGSILSDTTIVAGSVNAKAVAMVDGSGNQIVSFGGGTQYTDGGTPPTHPIGNTIEWSDGVNWQTVSTAQPLPITVKNTSLAVTGTFWQTTQPVSGTFWQTTQPVSLASLPALASGTNVIGHVIVDSGTVTTVSTVSNISQIASTTPTFTSQALDVNIKSETAPAVTPTRVAIAASSSGDNTLIAAVSAKKIYVVAFELSFSGTVNAKFTDGASGTNLGGLYYGVANAGAANSLAPDMKLATPSPYLFVGSTNTALILNLSGSVAVGGAITYFTV